MTWQGRFYDDEDYDEDWQADLHEWPGEASVMRLRLTGEKSIRIDFSDEPAEAA